MSYPRLPLIYVGLYGPASGGGPLEWTSDSYRLITADIPSRTTIASHVIPPGEKTGRFYYGDNIGRLFVEDIADTIPFPGYSLIIPAYQGWGDAGGDRREGWKITRLWSYIRSEESSWTIRIWPGQEVAYIPDQTLNQPITETPPGFPNFATSTYKDDVAASKLEQFPLDYPTLPGARVRYQEKVVHSHNTSGIPSAGHGHTFEFRFINPLAVEFIGFGGVIEPGDTSRIALLVTAE